MPGARAAACSCLAVGPGPRRHQDQEVQENAAAAARMAVEALRVQLRRQADARLLAGVLWQDNGLVFATAVGTPLDASDVRRSLRAVCCKAQVGDGWAPRDMRHTFVSLLSDNGMAIEEISRLVGHSSTNVTETVYRHQLRPVITTGAEVMEKLFSSSEQ